MAHYRKKAEMAFLRKRIRKAIRTDPRPVRLLSHLFGVNQELIRELAEKEKVVLPKAERGTCE